MTAAVEPRTDTPDPVQLRSAHDYALAVRALEERQEGIEKLAKKNEEEGYHRESRAMIADAAAIKMFILPAFRGQVELPLATAEKVREGIALRLRPIVRQYIKAAAGPALVKDGNTEQEDLLRNRETSLVEKLALYIETYVSAAATEAYNAGYAARDNDPEAIALRTIGALDA
jgi:hypothetical protein